MKITRYFLIFLFAIIIYFPVFLHLGSVSIRDWDESRYAVNAFEMSKNGNYLVTYYEGKPDLWNTKPPMMLWLQVASFKIFGYNELAVRFPTALAVICTIFIMVWFSKKFLENELWGYIASLILVCSHGYIGAHVGRTGDFDALQTLFTTFFVLCLFIYTEYNNSKKYLYLTFIGITLAALTKGVSGLLFMPAVLIWIIYRKKLKELLTNRHFYIGILIFCIFVFGFYLLREHYNPGYLKAVYMNELGGRYLQTIEGHQHEFSYYFFNLYDTRFSAWFYLIPLSIVLVFAKFGSQEKSGNKFILYLFLIILQFFFLISSSSTKLCYYDAPLFPLLAFICAFPILLLLKALLNQENIKSMFLKYVLTSLVIMVVFFQPYKSIINKIFNEEDYQWKPLVYGYFMKHVENIRHYTISHDGYNAHAVFYRNVYNDKGYKINIKSPSELRINDTVMVCENNIMDNINTNFNYKVIETWKSCNLVKLETEKSFEEKVVIVEMQIRQNLEWYNSIVEKAKKFNIPLDEMIKSDARYILTNKPKNN